MDIAIIGAGNIGGTLGRLLVAAGHRVRFGVRNPDAVLTLVAELGPRSDAGDVTTAISSGEAMIFAGPFGAWPEFAAENRDALAGKPVIDAANPYPARDGEMAAKIVASGTGSAGFVAGLLPRSPVVKAFNSIYWIDLRDLAGRPGERLAMPIAGDDRDAVALAARLADDAGFDPVFVGDLSRSVELDPGSPVYARSMTAAQVRYTLGLTVSPTEEGSLT
jgi:8-hydroxy-5-deazaflavin:NADPH oxidoreductase